MVFHLSALPPIIFWVILSFCLPVVHTDFSFLPIENFTLVTFCHAGCVLVFWKGKERKELYKQDY